MQDESKSNMSKIPERSEESYASDNISSTPITDTPKIPKFVFECQRCGKCCNRDFDICIDDIEQWVSSGRIYQMIPHLLLEGEYGHLQITFKKTDAGICPMLKKRGTDDAESVPTCTIFENMPASCSAFPLGHNGKNYIVVSKECQGINKGSMTSESLQMMRDAAKNNFEHKTSTRMLLPLLQKLFMEQYNRQSNKAYEKMSEEDKKKLEEIFSKKDGNDDVIDE